MFLSYCQRPCFTLIQNHRQNYSIFDSRLDPQMSFFFYSMRSPVPRVSVATSAGVKHFGSEAPLGTQIRNVWSYASIPVTHRKHIMSPLQSPTG
jgi:hypothetical protein